MDDAFWSEGLQTVFMLSHAVFFIAQCVLPSMLFPSVGVVCESGAGCEEGSALGDPSTSAAPMSPLMFRSGPSTIPCF